MWLRRVGRNCGAPGAALRFFFAGPLERPRPGSRAESRDDQARVPHPHRGRPVPSTASGQHRCRRARHAGHGPGRPAPRGPAPFSRPQATALATGAVDVLDGARVSTDRLEDAIGGSVLAVGLSARVRDLSHAPRALREAAPQIIEAAAHGPVALVFGNETFGLTNEELGRCRMLVTIPADPAYASLNLAAAVQVACYELANAAARFRSAAVPTSRAAGHRGGRRVARTCTGKPRWSRAAISIPRGPGASWSACAASSRARASSARRRSCCAGCSPRSRNACGAEAMRGARAPIVARAPAPWGGRASERASSAMAPTIAAATHEGERTLQRLDHMAAQRHSGADAAHDEVDDHVNASVA